VFTVTWVAWTSGIAQDLPKGRGDEMAHTSTARGKTYDLDLDVTKFGTTGMLFAKSRQMPNLTITGTDDADLWDCIQPVITGFFEASGERVQSLSVDRSGGPGAIKVHVELAAIP